MLSSSFPPSTFHLFSLIPSELRVKIWQHACPSRTISVRYIPETDTIVSRSKPPAVLHANHESRSETLRTYSLMFGTRSSPPRIYFDPYRDTLYFPRHRTMGYDETLRDFRDFVREEERGTLSEVRSIAIDHVKTVDKRPWEAYNKTAFLRDFPLLEELLLVLRDTDAVLGMKDGEEFQEPRQSPEELFRIWIEFRQSFIMEERAIEDVCSAMGKEYIKWALPTIKIKSKRVFCVEL